MGGSGVCVFFSLLRRISQSLTSQCGVFGRRRYGEVYSTLLYATRTAQLISIHPSIHTKYLMEIEESGVSVPAARGEI